MIMKINIKNPFSQAENLSYAERIKLLQFPAIVLSGLIHFAFVFLFMFIGVKEMMYFNIFLSLPIIILSYILGKQQKMLIAWAVFYFEISVHAVFATYYLGWDSGFFYYLLSNIILIHLGFGYKKMFRWIYSAIFCFTFILTFIFLKDFQVYTIDESLMNILYFANICVFVIVAAAFVYYFISILDSFEKKIKLNNVQLNLKNKLISEQKDEIEAQRDSIAEKKSEIEKIHKDVSDSIDYAKRIQSSILPEYSTLNENVNALFVFYEPKSKVSGDFYWWANIENHTVITAADCTGHGVPGAFMSMLGISHLREVVMKEYMTKPDIILRRLRKEIIKSLKQKGETNEQKDGMDLGLVCINHENYTAQFAGANNSLYVVSKNDLQINPNYIKTFKIDGIESKLIEIKADRMPIGIYLKMDKFIMHEFKIHEGDTFYLFSDGFADQFGGPRGKKFKYNSFKKLLLENAEKPMFEQKEILKKTFNEWKGDHEQIDDVVVLGFKIKK